MSSRGYTGRGTDHRGIGRWKKKNIKRPGMFERPNDPLAEMARSQPLAWGPSSDYVPVSPKSKASQKITGTALNARGGTLVGSLMGATTSNQKPRVGAGKYASTVGPDKKGLSPHKKKKKKKMIKARVKVKEGRVRRS